MTDAVADTKDPRQRSDVVLVTGENFNAHVDKVLGGGEEPAVIADDPAAVAAAELKGLEDAKAAKAKAEAADAEEIDHPEKDKKDAINERFSVLTNKRKAAEADAKAKSEALATERKAREEATAERDALRAKYEPPKSDVLGPEPTPDQFTDTVEYGKALKDWTAESVRRDDAKKASDLADADRVKKQGEAWQEKVAAHTKKSPEYAKKLENSTSEVSNIVRDAIYDSDVGPAILEHLADHPEVAERWRGMTGIAVLKAVGRLEAQLGGDQKATVTDIKAAAKAEVSKAPAPITPLGGGGAAVLRLSGGDEVPKNMTYDQWKKLRESGKIA